MWPSLSVEHSNAAYPLTHHLAPSSRQRFNLSGTVVHVHISAKPMTSVVSLSNVSMLN